MQMLDYWPILSVHCSACFCFFFFPQKDDSSDPIPPWIVTDWEQQAQPWSTEDYWNCNIAYFYFILTYFLEDISSTATL